MRVVYLALAALGVIMAMIYIGHVITWPSLLIPNPLNEKLSVNTQGVLQLYITALELNALGNYAGAQNITRILGITAAVKASPLISQLHVHESKLTNYLAQLRSIYYETINSLSVGNYSGARSLALEGLLIDGEANGELNAILNILNSAAPGNVGQVINAAQSIRQYLLNLNETFLNVLAGNYVRTRLTLEALPSTVVVGGQVLVYGTLTMINGTPIPNATVSIYIGGVYMGGALTNIHGNYSLEFPMPQIYLSRVNVTAIYNPPPGSDYLPSEATTPINVVFNTTSLTINYTREVMWGEPISISGYVSGPPSRSVIISVDGLNITTYTRNNAFSALINTENMTPGNYSIMVYAPPVGPYSPAYAEGLVELNSVVVNVTINTSPLVIAGLPIIVSGVVSPWVGNMSLSLSLGGETILLNLSSPNFTVSMRTSPLLGMGRHQIIVSVSSNPPIMGVTYAYGVFVLNILEVAVPIIIIVALLLVMRSGVISISSEEAGTVGALQPRLGPVRIELGPNAEVKTLREEIAKSVLSGKISIKNVRDIIDALANAVYAVSTKTGVKLRSTDTLREYLRAVRDKLGDEEYAVLEELIRLGEYALYSPHVPSDDEVRRAWELAKRLMQ